jgi:hypothetical protein
MTVLLVVCGAALAPFFTGCKRNRPPAIPQVSGPTLGKPAATLAYYFSSTDPENQEIAYTVSWGDSSHLEWTPYYPSGLPVVRTHAYSDTGIYSVRAKAKDSEDKESKWSDAMDIAIGLAPFRPELWGHWRRLVAQPCSVTAWSYDPCGHRLTYGFSWGDGSPAEWSDTVASGISVTLAHTYGRADTFWVRAVARNERGLESVWSDSLGLRLESLPPDLDAPYVTTVAVNDGGALRLTWWTVDGADSYEITTDDSVYTTADTSFDLATPTATIKVRAVSGSNKSDSTAIDLSVVEGTVEFFGDLDPTHANGFGFGDKGGVVACSLVYPSFHEMDFFADTLSYHGEMRLVSGAKVNQGRRGNAMKAASESYDGATIADPVGTYSDSSLAIMIDSTYYLRVSSDTTGTWKAGDHFAKANVVSIEGAKVTLKTAYQRIRGLRWVKSQ